MSNKVLLVTAPDDVFEDGVRVLLVGLTPDQQQIVSNALGLLDIATTVVTYFWNPAHIEWSIDKKQKSNLIIFNADYDDLVVGYLAAQSNSYYFGNLRIFGKTNTSAVYSAEQVSEIISQLTPKLF
jgi:hypothetical protein